MSRTYLAARGVAFAALVWCVACGDDSSGSDSSGTGGVGTPNGGAPNNGGELGVATGGAAVSVPPDVEAYFAEFTDLLCGGLSNCCSAEGLAFSEDSCRAIFDGIGAAFVGLNYDAAAGERCLAAIRSRAGDCSETENPFCDDVFTGTAGLGEPCRQTADCAPMPGGETECWIYGPGLDQSCVVRVRAALGDPCQESCFEGVGVTSCSYAIPVAEDDNPRRGQCYLNDDLRCDRETLTCVPTSAPGEACVFAEECGAYATCRDSVCSAAATDGEDCFDFSECAPDLTCDDMGVCRPAASQSLEAVCTRFSGG
jgi:hypothetical protein